MADQTSPEFVNELARNIGLLVFAANGFDFELGSLICDCFCLSSVQETVFVRPLQTRAKLDIIQRLARYVHDKPTLRSKRKSIVDWCEKAKDRLNERNTVVHGIPGIHEGKLKLRLFSSASAFTGNMEEWPPERVDEVRAAIHKLRTEVDTKIRPLFANWIEASDQYMREKHGGDQPRPAR